MTSEDGCPTARGSLLGAGPGGLLPQASVTALLVLELQLRGLCVCVWVCVSVCACACVRESVRVRVRECVRVCVRA